MAVSSDRVDKSVIRVVVTADAKAMADIYNHYVTQTVVTFDEAPVSSLEMEKRIHEVRSLSLPWFVGQREGEIAGYAYAGKWKQRTAYRFATEVAVYVAPDRTGQGIGTMLYGQLLPALKECGVHVAMGGIALPNDASIALHEKFGFKKAGHFREVGFKFDRWIDVGYWQCILQAVNQEHEIPNRMARRHFSWGKEREG